jgi:hypothetical protein
MVTQGADAGGDSIIVGGDRPSFTVGAEILTRIETEAPNPTDRSCPAAIVCGAMSLGGIFDERQTVPLTDL